MVNIKGFDRQQFINNVKLMVRYDWEPEIDIECKDGKAYGIIAYSFGIDLFDADNKLIKRLDDIADLFELISENDISSATDEFGTDFADDIDSHTLILDGKLYYS